MSSKPAASWRAVLPIHPAADLFPLMSETDPADFRALVEDIKTNGLLTPIAVRVTRSPDGLWSYELLDGRNRLDAVERAGFPLTNARRLGRAHRRREGMECGLDICLGFDRAMPAIEYVNPDDPVAYVISANIRRRHLTAEQKLDLTAKVLKANPEKSNASIAKQVKVDDKTVAKVRRDLEATSEIPRLEKTMGADGKTRKKPTRKNRRTEDDFRRDLQTKKAAAVATAMPGDIGPMLPDAVAANPITAAWDAATDEQRLDFVNLRRVDIARVETPPVALGADDLDDGIPPFLRRTAP